MDPTVRRAIDDALRDVGDRLRPRQLRSLGRFAEAIEAYELAVAKSPGDGLLRAELSTTLADAGRRREALAEAREAVRLAADAGDAHHALAYALAFAGEAKAALVAARRAVELQPADACGHAMVGSLCAALNRWPEADAATATALRIDPTHSLAVATRAQVLRATGRGDEADAALAAQLAHDAADENAIATLGWNALRAGRRGEAISHFREALRLRPLDADARHGLAEAMRSRSPIYGAFFRAIAYLSDRSPTTVIIAWCAVMFAPRLIVRLDRASVPLALASAALTFTAIIVGLIWMLLGPIGAALLYGDREARAASTPDERRHGRRQAAVLTLLFAIVLASAFTSWRLMFLPAIAAMTTSIGLMMLHGTDDPSTRAAARAIVAIAAVVAWTVALLPFAIVVGPLMPLWLIKAIVYALMYRVPIAGGCLLVAYFAREIAGVVASGRRSD